MTTPNRPSLWEVMERTSGTVANWDEMICAVRDWLVPEEGPVYRNHSIASHVQWARRDARAELRALLTTEADRAERGDHA